MVDKRVANADAAIARLRDGYYVNLANWAIPGKMLKAWAARWIWWPARAA